MRWFFGILLAAWAAVSHSASLEPVIRHHTDAAVVLVGGINDTFRYFEPWFDVLVDRQPSLYGFTGDHRQRSMTDNAQALATALEELQAEGVTQITIHAHSMGGLVAKEALHVLAQRGALARFKAVSLTAYGSPWGGSFWSTLAAAAPGSGWVVKALGFPMAMEMAPESSFMATLREPLPSNVTFVVVHSNADAVARPALASTGEQFDAVLAQANRVDHIEGVAHSGFVRHMKPAL